MPPSQSAKEERCPVTPNRRTSASASTSANSTSTRSLSSAGAATSRQPLARSNPRTPSKPGSGSTPQSATATQGPRTPGGASALQSANTPQAPRGASTTQSSNLPQGPRNPGSAGAAGSSQRPHSISTPRTISRQPPRPLRESPRAPKHTLESPGGQPLAKRPAPDLSQPHGKCVMIYVGDDRSGEPFIIHRNVLCHYSPYFEKVFKREGDRDLFISEGMPSVVYKDTTGETFGVFMQYVYRNSIKDNNGKYPRLATLLQFWVLASKIFVPEVQNAVVDGIFEHTGEISCDWALYVYNSTTRGSPLRKFIIDKVLIRRFTLESLVAMFEEDIEKISKELLADVIVAQKRLLSGTSLLPALRVTDYYVQGEGRRP